MDEEQAARRLAAAKARVILAEAGTSRDEYVAAVNALEQAEHDYVEAVRS